MKIAKVPEITAPPREFIDAVGGGDFHAVGRIIFKLVRHRTRLRRSSKILDIGCGCGRLAAPLTKYLRANAEYHGFDVDLPMINWCRENIQSKFPQFHFHHADLTNTWYNKNGSDAAQFRFPFKDNMFDVAVATSMFTHLLPASAERYASEIARTLAPQGKALLTFYLLTEDYDQFRAADKAMVTFDHKFSHYAVYDANNPEMILAFEDSYAIAMLRASGLRINVVAYGGWMRHFGNWSFQDVILAGKA